ncbi:MAG TPA: twin-arginine translocation signal domain-containing protein [Tepidisphaeraceae bacterium]|jgi:hypothetical protein|nr:twin-arginine translocation signal domain-containing protein [Tepidisphaeraceae bacterium]
MINRRGFLARSGVVAAALGLAPFPLAWADDSGPKRKLFFAQADVTPNIEQATPQYLTLGKE